MRSRIFYVDALKQHRLATLVVLASMLSFSVLAQNTNVVVDANNRLLHILLPKAQRSMEGSELAVELDGYDVSLFAKMEGAMLVLQMETPVAPGEHVLNVMRFYPDGEIETLVDSIFSTQAAEGEIIDWQLNATFATTLRLDEKVPPHIELERSLGGQGALAVKGHQESGQWQVTADLEAMYDSTSQHQPENEEWALPRYYLATSYAGEGYSSRVGAGNIRLQREDLLFSAYQRRGIQAEVNDEQRQIQVQLFGLKSEPATGYHLNQMFPSKRTERVGGATMSVAVLDEYLQVSSGYLHGETSWGASVLASDSVVRYGGDSWNLALDSRFLGNSLWFHGEIAESDFDSDGIGLGQESTADNALQGLIQLSSEGELGSGVLDSWSGFLQRQVVGGDYYSLGNMSLPGDLALTRFQFDGQRGGLAFLLAWSREKNNIDNDPLRPTQTLTRVGSELNYTPMWIESDQWAWKWLGSPSVNARVYRSHHDQPEAHAEVFGFDLDNTSVEKGVTLTFSKSTMSWSLQHQLVDRNDHSQAVEQGEFLVYVPPSDNKNRLTGWQLSWFPNQKLSLNAGVQWNKQQETDRGNIYRSRNMSIGTQVQVIPTVISFMMNYNYGRNTARFSDDLYIEDDFQSDFINAQLTWHAKVAKDKHIGINVFLKGDYGHQDNQAFMQNTEQWSALIGVETYWNSGAR